MKQIKARMPDTKRGSVLLFCLGVLAILSMLGTALIFISHHEAKSSRDYLDRTRAQLVAESGVETANAKLLSYRRSLAYLPSEMKTQPSSLSTPLEYLKQSSFGELDRDLDGLKEISGVVSESYSRDGDSFRLRVHSTQGKLNLNDSNAFQNTDEDPYADQSHPKLNYSSLPNHERPPVDPEDFDDAGTPRMQNDPDWLYPGDDEYNPNLASGQNLPHPKHAGRLEVIIRELVNILFPAGGGGGGLDFGKDVAAKIMAERRKIPGGMFSSEAEVKSALVPQLMSDAQYNLFRCYCTLNAWQDDSVLKPTFQWRIRRPPVLPGRFYSDIPICWVWALDSDVGYMHMRPKFGSVFNVNLSAFGLPDWLIEMLPPEVFEEILANIDAAQYEPDWIEENDDNFHDVYLYSDMQTAGFELDARCPVDINDAELPLLKALVRPISGWQLRERPDMDAPEYTNEIHNRVEDWSMPFASGAFHSFHPWFYSWFRLTQFRFPDVEWLGSLSTTGAYFQDAPDECSYFYYDELQQAYLDATNDAPFYKRKNGAFGRLEKVALPVSIADAISEKLYAAIHGSGALADFNPFVTWESLERFFHDLTANDGAGDSNFLPGFTPEMASLLIANFNPNSRINDFNPNKILYLPIDKSQLIRNTTEFCFHPMGYFEISSLGEVLDAKGGILSQAELYTLANPGFEIFRITNQSQFMRGYSPTGIQAKTMLGDASVTALSRTAGLSFAGGVVDASYQGHALQSYPEPEMADASNLITDSVFDGYIALAVYRPNTSNLLDEVSPIAMYANFQGSLNAAVAQSGDNLCRVDSGSFWTDDVFTPQSVTWRSDSTDPSSPYPTGWKSVAYWDPALNAKVPANLAGARRLANSHTQVFSDQTPGSLYADGTFSDAGRSLLYNAKNIGDMAALGRKGSLQFWLKPGFDVAYSNRIREFFSMAPMDLSPLYNVSDIPIPNGNPATFPAGATFIRDWTGIGWGSIEPPIPNYPQLNNLYMKAMGEDMSLYYFAHAGRRVCEAADPLTLTDTPPVYTSEMEEASHATHSLYFFTNDKIPLQALTGSLLMPSVGSECANFSWKSGVSGASPANGSYNFETRQWSNIALSWDFLNAESMKMFINGLWVGGRFQGAGGKVANLHTWANGTPNYVRFGESASKPYRNVSADSTYDVIVSSSQRVLDQNMILEYGYGRYFEGPCHYESPAYDLCVELKLDKAYLSLIQVAWTLYWPKGANPLAKASDPRFNSNRNTENSSYVSVKASLMTMPVSAGGKYPNDPMSEVAPALGGWAMPWAPMSFNFMEPSGGKWYYGDVVEATADMPNHAGGSVDPNWFSKTLTWREGQSFKFRAHFNMDAGQTLYDSPLLDDVTFVFRSSRAKILIWESALEE